MPSRSIDYSRRTALYRLFDQEGRLLYVGITFDPRVRWMGHAAAKSWWHEVARREVMWHSSRYVAEAAELAAIVDERPMYNIAGSTAPPAPTPPKIRRRKPVDSGEAGARIRALSQRRRRAKAAFERADAEVRDLLVAARADGVGPSDMSRWSGLTREWIAKIAPDPNRTAAS